MWSCVAVSGRFTLRHSVSGVVSATLRSAPYCVHNTVHRVHQEREREIIPSTDLICSVGNKTEHERMNIE